MADKETRLSIVLRTVDKATAGIKAINARLDAATKPVRDFKDALSDLRKSSGLDEVIGGFRGVGSAVAGVLAKVALIGGIVGVAVHGLFSLVDEFDQLGDKATEAGVSVEFLASLRFAAEQSGAAVEQLDGGLKAFSSSLGQARAGTGRMTAFLKLVSPVLLTQLKATKSNEEAFNLLAAAAAKIVDPAKRAAFAQKTLGDASLAPLLNQGAKGIAALRARYLELNPDVGEAAKKAGEVDESMKELKAATDGVKSSLLIGLAPALKVIVERLRDWLQGHRQDIKDWAMWLGERIPGAVSSLVDGVRGAVDAIRPFVDSGTKLKVILGLIAAVILGPVISAVVALGIALVTNPVGLIITGIALAAALIIKYWEPIKAFFIDLWDTVVGAFSAAWERIQGIVAKIKEAADSVLGLGGGGIGDALNSVRGRETANSLDRVRDVGAQATQAIGKTNNTFTKLEVEFKNAPPGLRVKTDPKNTGDVDLSVGHQMLGAM